ncbi:hypothetical protein [Halorussus halobius]|uniref:hypothetical protein n=1 Tax=Halorussus halobius TaxID=1710537 RepID=UPI00109332BF|nr:hypothetical protein [Halorussus halobius]
MSKTDESGFDLDSFASPDVDESESDSDYINLDAGESVTGEITDVNLTAGDNGLIEIDGKTLWLNATMRRQLESGLIAGEPVAHVKLNEERSFEDENGEEQTYNPRELRFKDD